MSDELKRIVRKIREKAPTDPSVLDGLYTEDYVYHGIPLIGDLTGATAFKNMYTGFVGAIEDFKET